MIALDFEMPKSCAECPLCVCYRRWSGDPGDEFCGYTKDAVNTLWSRRPDFCPLKEFEPRIKTTIPL